MAGIVFALAEMVMAVAMGDSSFDPLRLICSMPLGTGALSPAYPLARTVITRVLIHMVLSAIYGVIFVYLLALANQLFASTGLLLLYGSIVGFVL